MLSEAQVQNVLSVCSSSKHAMCCRRCSCGSNHICLMIVSVLQRFRFSTSLVYAVAVGLEFLTPLAPRYFLLLASIANVGKSVGLATHISTQPSFVKNFARQDNLSDLTAKAQVTEHAVFSSVCAHVSDYSIPCSNRPISFWMRSTCTGQHCGALLALLEQVQTVLEMLAGLPSTRLTCNQCSCAHE